MYELKTKLNDGDVASYLNTVEDNSKKQDCIEILNLMQNIMNQAPKMWGDSIIGFGEFSYVSKSNCKGDWFKIGFAPRKQNIVLYLIGGFDKNEDLMSKLGKYKTGKSCIYIKKLSDIDIDVLSKLATLSIEYISEKFTLAN